jgi:hypothetical protein
LSEEDEDLKEKKRIERRGRGNKRRRKNILLIMNMKF